MNIISILNDAIHYIKITTSIFGKRKTTHALVDIPFQEAEKFNLDVWAVYLKNALLQNGVDKFRPQKAKIILAQRFWKFARIEIPADIQEAATGQFLNSKLKTIYPNLGSISLQKFFIVEHRGKRIANTFSISLDTFNNLKTLLSFYEITAEEIYPEAMLIYHLFEHTLNKTKDEPILYVDYNRRGSYGLLYDSIGLKEATVFNFDSNQIKQELQKINKKYDKKIARLVLGGEKSAQIRQDTFTKQTGLWTNPLTKILEASSYSKIINKYEFKEKLLVFARELSLLKHIENKTQKGLAVIPQQQRKFSLPSLSFNKPRPQRKTWKYAKYFLFLAFSFGVTFFLLTLALQKTKMPNFKNVFSKVNIIKQPSPTPMPTPKPSPTPIPKVIADKESLVLEIQNGSGTPGQAAKLRSYLKDKGFNIESVDNADSFDYKNTVIIAKNKAIFNLLKETLLEIGVTKAVFEETTSEKVTLIIGKDLKLP